MTVAIVACPAPLVVLRLTLYPVAPLDAFQAKSVLRFPFARAVRPVGAAGTGGRVGVADAMFDGALSSPWYAVTTYSYVTPLVSPVLV